MKINDNGQKIPETFAETKNVSNASLVATMFFVGVTFLLGSNTESDEFNSQIELVSVLVALASIVLGVFGVVLARRMVEEHRPDFVPLTSAYFMNICTSGLLVVIIGNYNPIVIIPFAAAGILLNLTMIPRSHAKDTEQPLPKN